MKFTDVVTILPGMILSFVGCGGKTSVIQAIIEELNGCAMPLIHTTTTKVWLHEAVNGRSMISDDLELLKIKIMKEQKKAMTIGSGITDEGKLLGIPPHWVEDLGQSFPDHCLLVEADGCKGKSMKFYGDREPCVPNGSQGLVIILGMDAFEDNKLDEVVHRAEGFLDCFNGKSPTVEERIESLFWPRGLISGAEGCGDKYVFLNKVTDQNLVFAREIAKEIWNIGRSQLAGVIIGNTRETEICREVIT